MDLNPDCEWAYGCWRPGDIVLEPCVSFTHALKLTEDPDGGVVYRRYSGGWGKVAEHHPDGDDVIALDQHDMYPRMLHFGRRESLWH